MEPEKYNCLVVDDEPIARKIIVNYIEQMPSLQLAGECINALATIDYLRSNNNINIIFLDIKNDRWTCMNSPPASNKVVSNFDNEISGINFCPLFNITIV